MSAAGASERARAETIAGLVLDTARAGGAEQAAVRLSLGRFIDISWRDGQMEKASASATRSLTLRLLVKGRYGVHSTSDLRPGALKEFVRRAVELTRALQPDPLRALPSPDAYPSGPAPDLGLYDPAAARSSTGQWIALAREIQAAAAEAGVRTGYKVVSTQGGAYMELGEGLLVTSNGFSGWQRQTNCYAGAAVTLDDPHIPGGKRSGWWWEGERALAPMTDPSRLRRISTTAAYRAARQIGAKPGPGGRMAVVVENIAAGRLLEDLLGPMSGPALRLGRSYLKGLLGKQMASRVLTMRDEPLIRGAVGSRWFDSEGVAARAFTLVDAGKLRNYYLDTYHSRLLGLRRTTGSVSNLVVLPTEQGGMEQLASTMDEGIVVTSFLGGNFNSTTGEFSYGISGLLVKGGRIVGPVEGMNLAGEFTGLWKALRAVGNDAYTYSSVRSPSLMFEGLRVSGV